VSETSGRLLRLLSLLQTPREWPGPELAHRLEVTPRTVRRDVERLRALGYPVEASLGVAGGYRLTPGPEMPPLLLDDDEAVAIAVGLRVAAGHAAPGFDETSVRALAKVLHVLPSRLRHRVSAAAGAISALPASASPAVDPETLATLATAVANDRRVAFDYAAGTGPGDATGTGDAGASPAYTERRVDPEGLVAAHRRWYLVAFDLDRHDWRTFRVDRITNARPTGGRAPHRLPADDAATFLADRLHDPVRAQPALAILHAPATEIEARVGDSLGHLRALDGTRCEVRLHADTVEWQASRLALLGCEFEVLEPSALAEHVRNVGSRLIRAGRHARPRFASPRGTDTAGSERQANP
jgi:predicted DNA-binding transcriptional regulator YafY